MREVRFDMGREVILTLGGFKFLREYFKDLLPRKKIHTMEVTFAAGHVQKSKLRGNVLLEKPLANL